MGKPSEIEFKLEPEHVEKELGSDQFTRQLDEIRNFLQFGKRDSVYRHAPSIIARSEAELFGTSLPRFAVRCHFDAKGSFANLRRNAMFADSAQMAQWLPKPRELDSNLDDRIEQPYTCNSGDGPAIKDLIAGNNCIADSLLLPSHEMN